MLDLAGRPLNSRALRFNCDCEPLDSIHTLRRPESETD